MYFLQEFFSELLRLSRYGRSRLPFEMGMAANGRMNTAGGSFILLGAKFPRDATVVAKVRVREKGATPLGETTMN
ncbi:hypothetical protein GGTG_05942 [Gaeumannomyces tritici R3-111a-1]|uniref:Uncharacterized protein n=1 Tax=Gaeumannomyces tritici (strain R3-111a-1) TaxID=644352 RepID=J3NXD5_GAET3|nr:hypothetical protein GGTG_05942 [Gaeumannomyces tritici R3-111a-1]EJT76017.1 hypothetical protein GGTG_05942 [Gaeumannomyces tritici R3-111a-1]